MIVAMVAVRVVKTIVHQVVHVIAVQHHRGRSRVHVCDPCNGPPECNGRGFFR